MLVFRDVRAPDNGPMLVVDPDEIRRLWSLLPHPEGSVVRYTARRRSDDRTVGDFAETVEELIRAAETWQRDGFDMYVQVNPTRERARSRPRAVDITHWSWLLIDLDPVGTEVDPQAALVAYVHRLSLDTGTLLDPLILDSGRGMQAWVRLPDAQLVSGAGEPLMWPLFLEDLSLEPHVGDLGLPLAEPIEPTKLPASWVARRAHGFWLRHLYNEVGVVGGCALDTSVSDLPRLMRMAGTVNMKTGRMARIVSPGTVHERLLHKLVTLTPKAEFKEPAPTAMMVEGLTWSDVYPVLSLTAQRFLRYGKEEPGRHKDTVGTVLALRDAGLTPEATMAAVQQANAKSLPEPLKQHELDRMVRDAFSKLTSTP